MQDIKFMLKWAMPPLLLIFAPLMLITISVCEAFDAMFDEYNPFAAAAVGIGLMFLYGRILKAIADRKAKNEPLE